MVAFLSTLAAACTRENEGTDRKLDQVLERLAAVEKKLDARPAGPAAPAAGAPMRGQQQPGGPQPQRPGAPNPSEVYSVDITGDPVRGAANAKVTIVEAFEFACPFCQKVSGTIDQLVKDYPGQVRVVYKQYVVHPQTATLPALASCAAHQQGKYMEYYTAIFEKLYPTRDFAQASLERIAGELGLDVNKFKADMNGDRCKKELAEDQEALRKVGVSGTPAFFINGRFLSGAQPIENFKRLIDEELAKVEKSGLSGADYYQQKVVAGGKKSVQ
jgi:protein-disulfide isomerase